MRRGKGWEKGAAQPSSGGAWPLMRANPTHYSSHPAPACFACMCRFDGNNCSQALDEADDISRVLAVAAENARSARAAAEAAQEAALQQELHVMRQAQQLLDRIALFPKEQM